MSDPKAPAGSHVHRDTQDLTIPGMVGLLGTIVFLTVFGLVAAYGYLQFAIGKPARRAVPPGFTAQAPTAPIDPSAIPIYVQRAELASMEASLLTTYSWIDSKAGIVRIPIERALALVSERGLPVRTATATREP
jgi:hypothetical protein